MIRRRKNLLSSRIGRFKNQASNYKPNIPTTRAQRPGISYGILKIKKENLHVGTNCVKKINRQLKPIGSLKSIYIIKSHPQNTPRENLFRNREARISKQNSECDLSKLCGWEY